MADTKKQASYSPSHARDVMRPGFIAKLVLMMLIDALGLYGLFAAWTAGSTAIAVTMVIGLIIINWVYFSKRMLPAKYLVPGMVFLLVYQVFVMGYTGYVSLTNYGQGHNSTKDDAVNSILAAGEQRAEGAPTVPTAVVENGDKLQLVVRDAKTGKLMIGDAKTKLKDVDGQSTATAITSVKGHKILTFDQIVARQEEVAKLQVPVSDNAADGHYKTTDGTHGYLAKSIYSYDAKSDKLTNTHTGAVYQADNKTGVFKDASGVELKPGWRVFVGTKNYTEMFTGSELVGPFVKALIWSFVFSLVSVLSTFALGLFLAMVFHDKRVKGRKIYQSLLILPYAFPAFLSTLVWNGMLNKDFGFINQFFFGGAHIPWLENGWLAKLSILGVNLWLGFPYMFLVCLGALQSLPSDVEEAAKMDGATGLRTFWSVKLPLVLQSTVPLLIASFAFNFNNFSLIYMLTGGGPNYKNISVPVGETDVLISMVYKIAFAGGSPNYGLASAMSIFIFVVVGVIAWLGFRRTKALEEL
jgi:ABC-type sugar transport systems, permease components